jgi:hypothetical protein
MAAGFPVKADYASGDVLTAAQMNDLSSTLNYLDPTAKGDLFPASSGTALTRLAVGANDTVLTADSSTATGLKWAAASTGGSWSQSATGTISGAGVTISSLAGQRYWVFLANWAHDQTGTTRNAVLRFNGDTGANYYGPNFNDTFGRMAVGQDSGAGFSNSASAFVELANTSARKPIVNGNYNTGVDGAVWNDTSAITSITIALSGAGNFTNGTYYVWSFA